MNEIDKKKLDKIIFQSQISNFVTWDELYDSFDEDVIRSSSMEEILFILNQNNIRVCDFEESINNTETKEYKYADIEVYKFKDSLKYLRNYKNGDIFSDYLEGKKIVELCNIYNKPKDIIVKTVRQFAKYLKCNELERRFLSIFVNYNVSTSQAMSLFHLDMISIRYLMLKASTIKKEDYSKYSSFDDDLSNLVRLLSKKES